MGSLHSFETTLHSLQHTYLRSSIHTTQNFKWSRYTLTTLNISQFQTFIYLLETAHPCTTKQLTRHTTLHTIHHKYTTLSPHQRCERTLHSYTDDHGGQLIADVIRNSDHITLNTNTPTRVPSTTLQQTSSPPSMVKKCMEYRVEGRRPVGRPRKTWLESVEMDMAKFEIDKEDVHDRSKWRRNVNVMKRKSNPIGKGTINR